MDLLDHLLHANHSHDPQETISAVINPNAASAQEDETVETILPTLEAGRVVVVTAESQLVGILTKIDLIDYLTSQLK